MADETKPNISVALNQITNKVNPIDLPEIKPLETQSVPKKQSLKEWAMAGGGVPVQYKGREHVWRKHVQKYAAGGEVYNTVPDMSDGGQINQAPAFSKGGTVKNAVKSAVEGVVEGVKPLVDRLNMHFKDVTKRVPELQEGAQKIQGGEMTPAEYEKLVKKYKPVKPYEFIPKPATRDEAINALTADKRDLYGTPSSMLKAGDPVGLRLDIPAYSDHGVWVPAVHRQAAGFGAGDRVGYESVAGVMNPTFGMSEKAALSIAAGKPKGTIATIKGEWNPTDEATAVARAQEYLNNPEWVQVGMDPERHGYFYDRRTMKPITAAEEAIQVGPLVLAKKPQYGNKKDFKYAEGGDVHMGAGGLLKGAIKNMQKTLPAAERDANKAKFLSDSKVKDRLYHGTSSDITAFDKQKVGGTFGADKKGFFFSSDPKIASEYADFAASNSAKKEGANVMPAHVSLKNPLTLEGLSEANTGIRLKPRHGNDSNSLTRLFDEERDSLIKFAKQFGNDGILLEKDGNSLAVAFEPAQIKSAIGNRGTYDINEADITKADGGAIHMAKGGDVHMEDGGAAFGVFPQMKPKRSKQDPDAAKNAPLDFLRGRIAGTLGMPGDIESLVRIPYDYFRNPTMSELVTGDKTSKTFFPTSEDIEQRLPFRSDAPVSRAAAGLGSLTANPMDLVRAGKVAGKAAKSAKPEVGQALEEYMFKQGLAMPAVEPKKGKAVKANEAEMRSDVAGLKARGMDVPGVDFADPNAPPTMRMSEALGISGSEGKFLNFTEADRSRVFGPNRGGVGFSALQHYSEPHKNANTVWGFGNKSVTEKKINQNDPDNTVWTTYAGSPEQHKSNTVVVKDAVKTLQDANAKGSVHPEQIRLINERIRQATSDKGTPLFSDDFDITDPQALSYATTFDRRAAISDALMGTGVKKPMISKEFKQANPGVKWSDASNIGGILTRETDPVLVGANTFDVGPHLFTMDNGIIYRPDLNEAFPFQVTGSDLGLRFNPAPFRIAAPDFINKKGYGPNDPINAWALSRGVPRQFISEKYLTGLQKQNHKAGGAIGGLSQATRG